MSTESTPQVDFITPEQMRLFGAALILAHAIEDGQDECEVPVHLYRMAEHITQREAELFPLKKP